MEVLTLHNLNTKLRTAHKYSPPFYFCSGCRKVLDLSLTTDGSQKYNYYNVNIVSFF